MSEALQAIDALLDRAVEPDDLLREVVAELTQAEGVVWAGIRFSEAGTLVPGPEAGLSDPSRRVAVPVSYQGSVVGELAADGNVNSSLLAQISDRIATHVLLGWDTGGESWEP